MSITATDLKFRQSARMTDFDDGGGRMSAVEVVDGQTNNVFSDLSDADGIIGNVSLRLIYLQIDTANTDPLLKPFVFLTDLPQNDNVTVLLIGYNAPGSSRADARNYYESYRVVGVKSPYTLYGDHFAGSQMVQVYCRGEIPSPDIGDVLCLSVEAVGFPAAQQFVAVRKIESRTTQTFTDGSGDFQRDVIIMSITTPLVQTFEGKQDPERYAKPAEPSPTLVRFTQVSDSAQYYGFKACTVAPQTGDTVIQIGSPYIPAVPATQAETPMVDQLAGLGTLAYVPSGAANSLTYSATMSGAAGVEVTRYFGTSYAPGSLSITVGSVALRDDGHGNVVAVNPLDTGWSGTADYAVGSFGIARDVGFSGSVSATATPAGAVVAQSYTRAQTITAATRNISYVFQLDGQPAPGTVTVDYLALGKWHRLSDTGRGQVVGNAGEGSGSITYATGSLALTLGALPDVDSAIIVSWGIAIRGRNSSGEITVPNPSVRLVMGHAGIDPGTWSLAWTSGGVSKSASANSAGTISGDATGVIDHTAGIAEFTTSSPADALTQYHPSYDYVDPSKRHSEVFTPSPSGGSVSVTLAHAPVKARSIVARWSIQAPNPNGGQAWIRNYVVTDNGSGGFNYALSGTNTNNLTTGAIVLQVQ
ncbi:MAG: hypothetical protein ACTHK2_05020 [Dokdonella sp.]|uniref:hypothetical protein n=1 Tax=Dokdonella sp. TaxID=2291710 RepID=UPI003F7FBD00